MMDGIRVRKELLKKKDSESLQSWLNKWLGRVIIAPSDKIGERASDELKATVVLQNAMRIISDRGSEMERRATVGSNVLIKEYSAIFKIID